MVTSDTNILDGGFSELLLVNPSTPTDVEASLVIALRQVELLGLTTNPSLSIYTNINGT